MVWESQIRTPDTGRSYARVSACVWSSLCYPATLHTHLSTQCNGMPVQAAAASCTLPKQVNFIEILYWFDLAYFDSEDSVKEVLY